MALYLAQHGKSEPKEVDPEKGLSAQGDKETQRIAQVARGYNIGVKKIVHSGKKRAQQTALIYHEALAPETPLEEITGINPLDDVKTFAENLTLDDGFMVVGHLPFLERLVSYLTTGSANILVYKFQNSGIVCLDVLQRPDGVSDWFIKWTLNPTIS